MTKSKPSSSAARMLERTLLVAGLAAAGTWLASIAIIVVFQSWDSWAFQRHSQGEAVSFVEYLKAGARSAAGAVTLPRQPSTAAGKLDKPVAPANNELIGRLAIARLQLSTTVREGTGSRTLALAPGHIRGTALPGQNGNFGIAGHRDTFFQSLADIHLEDLIEFETMEARYVYKVTSTRIVKPEDVGVLKAGIYPELTLVTCYPFGYLGSAPDRFIVKARLISQNPFRPGVTIARREEVAAVRPIPAAVKPAADPPGRVSFQVGKSRSRQLAPGISVGVTDIDVPASEVNGWVWVMPDRRTVWLRNQKTNEPLVFYQDGERRELTIARVSGESASGYLQLR